MQTYRLKGASGKVANTSFGLRDRTRIGSSPECELVVAGETIAPQHAEISLESDGSLVLRHLDKSFETQVNGISVDSTSLCSGDEIRIGSYRWVLQAPGLRPEKVLTVEAVKQRRSHLPWLIALSLIAAAALAWQRGLLIFL